jgi:arsenite methyltransferase
MIDQYRQLLRDAGFDSVVVSDSGADLNAYALATDAPSLHEGLAGLIRQYDANEFAASVRVHALKIRRSS